MRRAPRRLPRQSVGTVRSGCIERLSLFGREPSWRWDKVSHLFLRDAEEASQFTQVSKDPLKTIRVDFVRIGRHIHMPLDVLPMGDAPGYLPVLIPEQVEAVALLALHNDVM